jgi:hypothetical protein
LEIPPFFNLSPLQTPPLKAFVVYREQ